MKAGCGPPASRAPAARRSPRRTTRRRSPSAVGFPWWSSRPPARAPQHVPRRRRRPAGELAARRPAPADGRGARGVRARRGALVRHRLVDGRLVWHSLTHYLPTPLECWSTRGSSGAWCCRARSTARAIDDIAAIGPPRPRRRSGCTTGLSHMEWFRRDDGSVAISEVGARPPGAQITTLMSCAHDMDLYAAWARLCCRDAVRPAGAPVRGRRRLPPRARARAGSNVAVHGLDRSAGDARAVVDVRASRSRDRTVGDLRGRGLRHRPPPRDRAWSSEALERLDLRDPTWSVG